MWSKSSCLRYEHSWCHRVQKLFDEYPSVVLCVTHHPRIVANIFGSRWQDVLQAFDEVSQRCERMPITRLLHMRTVVVSTRELQSWSREVVVVLRSGMRSRRSLVVAALLELSDLLRE